MIQENGHWVQVHPNYDFKYPELKDVFDLWEATRAGRMLPRRSEFDPIALKAHLGWIVLIDVEPEPIRFRYRLVGSNIAEMAGRDVTGSYLDELYDPDTAFEATKSFRMILETKKPNRVTASLLHAEKGHLTFEAIDLPLSDDGENVNIILVRSVFDLKKS